VTGKLIALSPVLGNVTRLMTRCYYMVIETRITWDRNLCLTLIQEVLGELLFCRNNIRNINFRLLTNYSPPTVILYSYASNLACGAYSVEDMNNIFHKMRSENEKIKSSTWREMKAIEQALITFKEVYKYKNIKWYTDNQNCVKILRSGSMKERLQKLTFSIFSLCLQRCIYIDIQWIPRSENSKADYISIYND
jgi:hypothetical protein